MTGKLKEHPAGVSVTENQDLKEETKVGHIDAYENIPSDF